MIRNIRNKMQENREIRKRNRRKRDIQYLHTMAETLLEFENPYNDDQLVIKPDEDAPDKYINGYWNRKLIFKISMYHAWELHYADSWYEHLKEVYYDICSKNARAHAAKFVDLED